MRNGDLLPDALRAPAIAHDIAAQLAREVHSGTGHEVDIDDAGVATVDGRSVYSLVEGFLGNGDPELVDAICQQLAIELRDWKYLVSFEGEVLKLDQEVSDHVDRGLGGCRRQAMMNLEARGSRSPSTAAISAEARRIVLALVGAYYDSVNGEGGQSVTQNPSAG